MYIFILGSLDNVRQKGSRPPKRWKEKITDWTELTQCEADKLLPCHKIVRHRKGLYLAPTVADQETRRREEDSAI